MAKLLDLDICFKKVFRSACQDATFVKIWSKSEHFDFWGDQIRDSRTLEFRVRETEDHKSSPISMKFSQKLRLEKLTRNLFCSKCLNPVVLQSQPVLCGCNPGHLTKSAFFPSRNLNFLENWRIAPQWSTSRQKWDITYMESLESLLEAVGI